MSWESDNDGEVSINTKRLSAMIDSFHDNSVDEFLFIPRSSTSSPDKPSSLQSSLKGVCSPPDLSFHPPTVKLVDSKGNSHSLSPSNEGTASGHGHEGTKGSISSDYTASIHEAQPVSYVNLMSGPVLDGRYEPRLPPLPTKEEMKRPVGLGLSPALEVDHNFPSHRVPDTSSSPKRKSLRLISFPQLHHRKTSSLGSENLASDSGILSGFGGQGFNMNNYNYPSEVSPPHILGKERSISPSRLKKIKEEIVPIDIPNSPTRPIILDSDEESSIVSSLEHDKSCIMVADEDEDEGDVQHLNYGNKEDNARITKLESDINDRSTDSISIVSSIVTSLKTNIVDKNASGQLPNRSVTSDYQPTIPARSRNRPKSTIFIQQGLENIQRQLEEEMGEITGYKEHSRETSISTAAKSESYFSAPDQALDKGLGEETLQTEPEHDDHGYLGRPVHIIPESNRNSSINTITKDKTPDDYLNSTPTIIQRSSEKAVGISGLDSVKDEDEWIDEYNDEQAIGGDSSNPRSSKNFNANTHVNLNTTAASSSHNQPKPKIASKTKKRKDIRSFDIETITQLMNAAKGTLVGSEFANLGIRTDEKRALERLVDSLSRLTADMIVDPDRYAEGLKRLDKATKALDGF